MKQEIIMQDTRPGVYIGGGIYAGQIGGDKPGGLILAPKDGGVREGLWSFSNKSIPGTQSMNDGLANTMAMARAGEGIAQWATGLSIGGYGDWFIPSTQEQQFLHKSFLGRTCESVELDAIEGFDAVWHFSSTEYLDDAELVWGFSFHQGRHSPIFKSGRYLVRAVRRVPIH